MNNISPKWATRSTRFTAVTLVSPSPNHLSDRLATIAWLSSVSCCGGNQGDFTAVQSWSGSNSVRRSGEVGANLGAQIALVHLAPLVDDEGHDPGFAPMLWVRQPGRNQRSYCR